MRLKLIAALALLPVLCFGQGANSTGDVATKATPNGTIVGTTDAQTLTAKRVTPRVSAVAFSSTVTPNGDTTDVLNIGTLTGAITIAAPTGTPTDGQKLLVRIVQDATGGRVATFNAIYAFGTDVTTAMVPTTASAKCELAFIYNATDSTWRAVGISRGF